MPKNSKPKGMRQPSKVLNSMGVWVNNKYAGMRTGKNTNISDIQRLKEGHNEVTPTSPILARIKQAALRAIQKV